MGFKMGLFWVVDGLIGGYDLLMGWSVVDGFGCEIGMGLVGVRLARIGVGGVGYGWWVLAVDMGGAGFACKWVRFANVLGLLTVGDRFACRGWC